MKKIIAWLLVLAMTAAISIGATLAYLTDTDEDVNVMTIGNVKIDQLEYERVDDETAGEDATVQEFHDNKPLYPAVTDKDFDYTPGDTNVDWTQIGKDGYATEIWNPEKINNELDKMVFVKNEGTYDAYVRTIFAFEAGNFETPDQFKSMVHLNLNDTDWSWEWLPTAVTIGQSDYFIAVATYKNALAPEALTEISLSQIALDKTATNADVEAFGETYQILVKTQAIQAEGFADATSALNEGFGLIDEENIPWETDAPTEGATLKTALHYLNGDTAGTKITGKVASVTFGLNEDYPEIRKGYEGTLADVDQDVPVYAYYVPNGSNYDVYFLANDEIYAPESCYQFFYEGEAMSALKSVNLENLNTSRTTNMARMFRNCTGLTSLDLTGLDTSNVTDMNYMFYSCTGLKSLDVTGLDTGAVTNMNYMFYPDSALSTIEGMNTWDVSSVTNMSQMFRGCSALTQLDLAGWDTGKVTNMNEMFRDCAKLVTLDASGWDVSSVTNMTTMFAQCYKLQTLNATGWNPVNVTSTRTMFFNDYELKEVIGSGDWDLSSNKDMYYMFQSCRKLTYLDGTNWDCGNVTSMEGTFYDCQTLTAVEGTENWNTAKVQKANFLFQKCYKLVDVDVSNWDVSSIQNAYGMFSDCQVLPVLDVSNWNFASLDDACYMFNHCYELQTLDTVNFGMDNVTKAEAMFQSCVKLTYLDVSNWNTGKLQNMGHMFYGLHELETLDLSKWDVTSVTTLNHTFADCHKVRELDLSNWNYPKLTSLNATFNDCYALTEIDLSHVDTSNVTIFAQAFERCHNLETIIGMETWDTSKGNDYSEMFMDCYALKSVDLSAFDTSAATCLYSMFSGATGLETIYVGDGWDMSKVNSSGSMFGNCPKLVGANGTTTAGNPTDVTYACVDTEQTPGYLTYKAPANP